MVKSRKLTTQQLRAIRASIKLGKILQTDHPELADLYRIGHSYPDIVEICNLRKEYVYNNDVLVVGVRRSFSGYDGKWSNLRYEGTLSEEERKRLAREHGVANGKKQGKNLFLEGKGIHGRTYMERMKYGKESYGKSLVKRSYNQRVEDGRKGLIAQGKTPWNTGNPPEIEVAHGLSFLPEYQKAGIFIRAQEIADYLNEHYHDGKKVRRGSTVTIALCNYRKSLEERV